MSTIVTETPDLTVGTVPSFVVTFSAADDGPATVDAVAIKVRRPDGSKYDDNEGLTELSPNVWRYVGGSAITAPGTWQWRVTTTGTLAGAWELSEIVPYSPF